MQLVFDVDFQIMSEGWNSILLWKTRDDIDAAQRQTKWCACDVGSGYRVAVILIVNVLHFTILARSSRFTCFNNLFPG
jgi:hypothetical protein